jgi:hypothetical protein
MDVFWRRTTSAAGLTGLVVGFVAGMFGLVLDIFKDSLTKGRLQMSDRICQTLFMPVLF